MVNLIWKSSGNSLKDIKQTAIYIYILEFKISKMHSNNTNFGSVILRVANLSNCTPWRKYLVDVYPFPNIKPIAASA